MSDKRRAVRAAVLAAIAAGSGAACQDAPPPYGEAVIIVDTDLAVPTQAARLRVDVFDEGGVWLSTRDIALSSPTDWPVSFSVFTKDEATPRDVLVRLRAYPEGKLRDYLGERFEERPQFVEPSWATTVDELCADPPELVLGQELTLRRGADFVTQTAETAICQYAVQSGAVAARVNIVEAGEYRFEVIRNPLNYATLSLRTDCATGSSQFACDDQAALKDPPRIDVDLEPGQYFLIGTGTVPFNPADITVRGTRSDLWDVTATEPPPAPSAPLPRLMSAGIDVTPESEPMPSLTIDRLVAVRLEPGEVGSVEITLRGACVGTMSRLAAGPAIERAVLEQAETCTDTENVRVPLEREELDEGVDVEESSEQGTFGVGQPCSGPNDGPVVCVPGGTFVLGSTYTGLSGLASSPERVAVVPRFWMDRNEVTVARFREALDQGFVPPFHEPWEPENVNSYRHCSWTPTPGPHGTFGVSCIDWYDARAFCVFFGGDLPTEAQWEYAAAAAARPRETDYPWGDDPPTCDTAVFAREDEYALCSGGTEGGPLPVDARAATDRTPVLGIENLGGGLSEWTLDSARNYDDDCWAGSSLVDRRCFEEMAPLRTLRGGSWAWITGVLTNAAGRAFLPPVGAPDNIGFRCVYPEPP